MGIKMHLVFFFPFILLSMEAVPAAFLLAMPASLMVPAVLSRVGSWVLLTAWLIDALTDFCRPGLKTILFNVPIRANSPHPHLFFLPLLTSLPPSPLCLLSFQMPPVCLTTSSSPTSVPWPTFAGFISLSSLSASVLVLHSLVQSEGGWGMDVHFGTPPRGAAGEVAEGGGGWI